MEHASTGIIGDLETLNKIITKIITQTFVLIECQTEIIPYLLHIINLSFNSDLFPVTVKHTTVVPIVEDVNGDTEDFKNYRPVSNTPFLGKHREKLLWNILVRTWRLASSSIIINRVSGNYIRVKQQWQKW